MYFINNIIFQRFLNTSNTYRIFFNYLINFETTMREVIYLFYHVRKRSENEKLIYFIKIEFTKKQKSLFQNYTYN